MTDDVAWLPLDPDELLVAPLAGVQGEWARQRVLLIGFAALGSDDLAALRAPGEAGQARWLDLHLPGLLLEAKATKVVGSEVHGRLSHAKLVEGVVARLAKAETGERSRPDAPALELGAAYKIAIASARDSHHEALAGRSSFVRRFAERFERFSAVHEAVLDMDADAAEAAIDVMLGFLGDAIPEASDPAHDLGPFYSTTGLARRLKVSRQALDGRVQRNTLLAIPASDGSRLYPIFQFVDGAGRPTVVPGLSDVMKRLADGGAGPMGIAAWLTAASEELDGTSAVDFLKDGGDVERVLDVVDRDVARWGR